ncbi:MAG: molybdopterin dinucleotide binding domain-containing protein [Syntrophales bacterium]
MPSVQLVIITYRDIFHWSARKRENIESGADEKSALVRLSEADLKGLGIVDGAEVMLSNDAGSVIVRAELDPDCPQGLGYMPVSRYSNELISYGINEAKLPNFKRIEVSVEPTGGEVKKGRKRQSSRKGTTDKIQPLHVYQMLPGTDCKVCGCGTCMAYAFALIGREKVLADCPDLQKEEFKESLEFLQGYFGEIAGEVAETGLLIDKEKCFGCGDCAIVCKKAITSLVHSGSVVQRDDVPPVLEIINGVVEITNWGSCKRTMNPPEYCRLCEDKCTSGALEIVR